MASSPMDATKIPVVVRAAVGRGLVRAPVALEDKPVALFYDLAAYERSLTALRDAFGPNFLHAVAVKSNPMCTLLRLARGAGHGTECASIAEVVHSLNMGFEPGMVVYDSPCKTFPELRFALQEGIHVNIDSEQELARADAIVEEMAAAGALPLKGVVGIRVNPLVGAGDVAELSVSNLDSKFGIPFADKDDIERVTGMFVQRPWITALHVHVGSQGMGLDAMVAGLRRVMDLAAIVDAACAAVAGAAGEGVLAGAGGASSRKRITHVDMGGGLPNNFEGDDFRWTFGDYAARLRDEVPELFAPELTVVTEFGAALNAKFGWIAAQVEYTKEIADDKLLALVHAGADLLMRECYSPGKCGPVHRVSLYDGKGLPKKAEAGEGAAGQVVHNIGGPLCFAGDVPVKGITLPRIVPGDIITLQDCGSNTLSVYSRHCSRQAPAAYGYRFVPKEAKGGEDGGDNEDETVVFFELKAQEEMSATLAFWGENKDAVEMQ